MSTDYYLSQYPISGLELAEGVDYNTLTIYVNDGLSGALNLPKSVSGMFIQTLIGDVGVGDVAMTTWWCGKEEGAAVMDYACLPNDTVVISARGELLTAGQVRALEGRGKT